MSGFGQPPGGGGFGQPPGGSGGGGFGQPPAGGGGGGGFGEPPAGGGGGGFGAPPGGGVGQPPGGGGFGAPPPAGMGGGPSPAAANKVALPAILLLVSNGIGVAMALLSLAMNIFSVGVAGTTGSDPYGSSYGGGDQAMANMMSGTVGIVSNIIALVLAAFIIWGLIQMKNCRKWGVALTAVILGAIPCLGSCWCLALPLGIWALIVLVDPEVKASFS